MLDAVNLVAGRASIVVHEALAVINLFLRSRIEVNVCEQVGVRLAHQEASKQANFLIRESIVRHGRGRIVIVRIAHPCLQPLRLYLGTYFRQFRTHIAAHQIARGVLHGVAGGTERFSVQAGRLGLKSGVVFHFLCLIERSLYDFDTSRCARRNKKRRNVAGVFILQFEIRHGRGSRICLRIFQPCIDPFACRLVGDVCERRRIVHAGDHTAIRTLNRMAVNATILRQHLAAEIELRSASQILLVALSAGRLQVLCGQQRFFPGERAHVSFFDGSRSALSTMAHRASKLFELMRDRRMRTVGLRGDVHQRRFFESRMTGLAAIDDIHLGQPDLLDAGLEVAAQGDGVTALADQFFVAALVAPPFGKMILGGSDRQ